MKYRLLLIVLSFIIIYPILTGLGNSNVVYHLLNNKTVVFLNKKQGYNYVVGSGFIDSLSKLDISLRMEKDFSNSNEYDYKSRYRKFHKDQFRDWSIMDKKFVIKLLQKAYTKVDLVFPTIIPDTLFLIRTTGKQEFKSFYTQKNAIICPSNIRLGSTYLPFLGYIKRYLENVFIHEMFHIYTTNHSEIRDQLYEVLGFSRIDNLSLPPEITNRIIHNPDDKFGIYRITLSNKENGINNDYYLAILSKYSEWIGYVDFPARLNVLLVYLESALIKIQYDGNDWIAVEDQDQKYYSTSSNIQKDFKKRMGLGKDAISPEEIVAHLFVNIVQSKFNENFFNDKSNFLHGNCSKIELVLCAK